ncbi:hypothetical protein F280043A3_27000 [Intestinibacter bartlettii]
MTRVDMFYLILVVIIAIACLFWKLGPNFFVKRLNKKSIYCEYYFIFNYFNCCYMCIKNRI